jgi:hypothetical protein
MAINIWLLNKQIYCYYYFLLKLVKNREFWRNVTNERWCRVQCTRFNPFGRGRKYEIINVLVDTFYLICNMPTLSDLRIVHWLTPPPSLKVLKVDRDFLLLNIPACPAPDEICRRVFVETFFIRHASHLRSLLLFFLSNFVKC